MKTSEMQHKVELISLESALFVLSDISFYICYRMESITCRSLHRCDPLCIFVLSPSLEMRTLPLIIWLKHECMTDRQIHDYLDPLMNYTFLT